MKELVGFALIVFLAGFASSRSPLAGAQSADRSVSRLRPNCRPATKSRRPTKPIIAKPTAPAERDPGVVQGRAVMPDGNVGRGLRVRRPQRFGWADVAKLPTCSSTSEAQLVRDIGSAVETRVSVRGILTVSGWSCTLKGCVGGSNCCANDCGAHWILEATDPKAGVLGLLQGMESLGSIDANECHLPPKLPRLDVIASGVLVPSGDYHYSLDEVSLCALRPAPSPHER